MKAYLISQTLYGNIRYDHVFENQSKEFIDTLNSIDLALFQNMTYSKYVVTSCMYNGTDCRHKWTRVGTIMGQCLRLDLNKIATITSKAR